MKIECSCGITHHVFDWPSAKIEENNKKMIERHITCSCKREVVLRTDPMDEPDNEEGDEDEGQIFSFEELSRRLGVKPPPQPIPQPPPQMKQSKGLIVTDTTDTNEVNQLFTVHLSQDEAETLNEALSHYATVFKPMEEQAKEQQAYLNLATRCKFGFFKIETEKDASLIRCSLSERNTSRLYPVDEYGDETDHNFQRMLTVRSLRDRLFKEFEAHNV